MSITVTMPPNVAHAVAAVSERYYTHHDGRGPTPHRSNPLVIHRELTTLDLTEGMHVLEIGTGSGYSGALLAHLVGPTGQVVSLDIDPYLVRWAGLLHHQRGAHNIRCFTTDGTTGHPSRAPYDRLVAWCTPPLLPKTWVDQIADDGLMVVPLPIAVLPNMTLIAQIRITDRQPHVEQLFHGGYIEATPSPHSHFDTPARWVDWENRIPATSWISVAWRNQDDHLHTGARHALDLLLTAQHTEPCPGDSLDWASWRTFAAATGDVSLTLASVTPDTLALGHSTPTSAAVLQEDGTILADRHDSPSLAALRNLLAAWEQADRPEPETYTPTLTPADGPDGSGWTLRLTR